MIIGSTEWKKIIIKGTKALGINIDKKSTKLFAAHADELVKWNKAVNLTSITDPFDIAVKHYIDSIYPVSLMPKGVFSILDMGPGGGFPGIPLKIMLPDISFTLIDSSRKKVGFLKHIIRSLNLNNITAHQVRAEFFFNDTNFKPFDIIICRAFSSLKNIAEKSLPLLGENGTIFAMKGHCLDKEIVSLSLLNQSSNQSSMGQSSMGQSSMGIGKKGLHMSIKKYTLPFIGAKRTVVMLKQTNSKA